MHYFNALSVVAKKVKYFLKKPKVFQMAVDNKIVSLILYPLADSSEHIPICLPAKGKRMGGRLRRKCSYKEIGNLPISYFSSMKQDATVERDSVVLSCKGTNHEYSSTARRNQRG